MTDNGFFKLTPLYKEFMLLDMIEKNSNITQRDMSATLGVALSMINSYLDMYEDNGLIIRKYNTAKNVEYLITDKGIERSRLLNLNYLHSTQVLYNFAKQNIKNFIEKLIKNEVHNLIIYGAGEVADIILNMMYSENLFSFFNVTIIDDDKEKTDSILYNLSIKSFDVIDEIDYDVILIGSYTYRDQMMQKLVKNIKIEKNRIISFFNS